MKKKLNENIILVTILLLVLVLGMSSVSAFSVPKAQTVSTTIRRQTTIPIGNLTYNGFRYKIINEEAAITARSLATGDITIPDEIDGYPVTSIMHSAFINCEELTSITIPKTVTSIGNGVFSGTSNLSEIIVDSENPCYSNDEQGVLFNKDKTNLIHYPSGKSNTEYVIPDTVITITPSAFDDCNRLTHITIGKSVKNLNTDYFRKTNNLKTIAVSNENEYFSSDICGILFNKDKTELLFCPKQNPETEYTIPETVLSVSNKAFYENQNLVSLIISDSVVDIGTKAFEDCAKLTKVTIGNNVNNISQSVFYNCGNLKEVIIGNSIKSIDKNAFSGCKNLFSISIPPSVEEIGDFAFWECHSLTSIKIPASVKAISNTAFMLCENINEFTVSPDNISYSNDEHGVLFNIDKTELIQFPYGCNLTEYYIPDSVITVHNTFGNCEHITIGKSVSNENSDFWHSKNLKTITVSAENNYFSNDEHGVLFSKDKNEILRFPCKNDESEYVIPNGITTIGTDAFSWCHSLNKIIIPDSVTKIKSSAFNDCYNIAEVKLPNNLLSIGSYAFDSCDSMKKIVIPKNVTSIGEFAFGFTNNLFTMGGGAAEGATQISGFKIYCYADSAGYDYAIEYSIDYEIITDSEKQVTINQKDININYKETLKLSTDISDSSENTIVWQSSNPEVATVDENGNITATGSGTATITATIEGTDISDSCKITVSYAWWQWLIRIFLLGFIWY